MNKLLDTLISNGGNKGYCIGCENYFKKGDLIIIFDKLKVDRVFQKKICVNCYLEIVAEKIGWKKLNEILINNIEEKI